METTATRKAALRLLKSLVRRRVYETRSTVIGSLLDLEQSITESAYKAWNRELSALDLSDPRVRENVETLVNSAFKEAVYVIGESMGDIDPEVPSILRDYRKNFEPRMLLPGVSA